MKCSEIDNYIVDHVLDELSPELQIQVNEHLAVCKGCLAEAERAKAVISDFKNAARFVPAPGTFRKIVKQVQLQKPQRARFFGLPRGLVYSFAAFLFGVVITKSIDRVISGTVQPVRIEVRQEIPRGTPYSDTVEFYAAPAKNLARI
ncbi:MAG: zf-HC2 domain-containing protein [candidate division WOR-3 bacterium]|nr:MAG: zf-HC2 domain-containing protein [candidate division WOR-3 bacterium]